MARTSAAAAEGSRTVAVLGPTNTGKTHLAMERMLGHASGMIGFPLRLLARENYDRAVKIKGERRVALITGEEKIVPPEASWFLCTVEAMPVDRRVAFLGIDEIQMCADPDRGHLFTDRLLSARGELETMFMGAETIRPLLRRLVPGVEFIVRPRFSALTHAGPCKLTRLPRRTAVVAFSAADVYGIAELIRRQRGGAAIVLGALSPRTRNAQVAMYQAGEVDYLVATDAIGMGLNMHVDHVAFAATRKFDGRGPRRLTAAEMAQIAGRAGRHTRDGSFGTTAEIGSLDAELAQRIESHTFEPLTALKWRNSELRFASLEALRTSLGRLPDRPGLTRAREADDELALAHLAADAEIGRLARGPAAVALLWDVCRIPDFGKVAGEAHARLLGQMFRYLMGAAGNAAGRLPTDWVARQVDRLNRSDGDIETLMQRIAGIRTWTYVSHQSSWLADADAWQQRARAIEDKLSDALHERLIQRFVDRRTASLVGHMRARGNLTAAVSAAGEVLVEGHFVGTLDGFRFAPDPSVGGGAGDASRSVTAAAVRALATPIRRRVGELEADDDCAFTLAADGMVLWRKAAVGHLQRGADVLTPWVEVLASDLLPGEARTRLRAGSPGSSKRGCAAASLPLRCTKRRAGAARGLLCSLPRLSAPCRGEGAQAQIAALSRSDRRTLAESGVRFGSEMVWMPRLLKPEAMALRGLLWWLHAAGGAPRRSRTAAGAAAAASAAGRAGGVLAATGYRRAGEGALRIDIVERLHGLMRRAARAPAATPLPETDLLSLIGCPAAVLPAILAGLGYPTARTDAESLSRPRRPGRTAAPSPRRCRARGQTPACIEADR
ncbi:MAG: helicase-related protein [Rhodospirillales bacterium]